MKKKNQKNIWKIMKKTKSIEIEKNVVKSQQNVNQHQVISFQIHLNSMIVLMNGQQIELKTVKSNLNQTEQNWKWTKKKNSENDFEMANKRERKVLTQL